MFIKQEFELAKRNPDGSTVRDTYLKVSEITGRIVPELQDLVELPASFKGVWYWFLELNQTRPSGFGAGAITYTEMQSYFNLLGILPEVWEIRLLKIFDSVALDVMSKQQKDQKPNGK